MDDDSSDRLAVKWIDDDFGGAALVYRLLVNSSVQVILSVLSDVMCSLDILTCAELYWSILGHVWVMAKLHINLVTVTLLFRFC